MKNFIKNLLSKSRLYKAELTVICTILLCFVISGICLPVVKGQLPAEESSEEQISAHTVSVEKTEAEKTKNESIKNEKKDKETTVEKKTDNAKKETKKEDKKASENAEAKVAADEPQKDNSVSTIPQNPTENNSGNTSPGSTSSENNVPVPQAPPQAPPEPEKVWVPPVYTTVHHEAVYETIQMVCCNYCGATFGSVGEFQVHKDANGG